MLDVALGVGALAALLAVIARPGLALSCSLFLLMLGGTKFRNRDPAALLRGDIDAQVLFEIGISAFVAAIAVVATFRLARSFRLSGIELLLGGYLLLVLGSALWSPTFEIAVVRALQLCTMAGVSLAIVRWFGVDRAWSILAVSAAAYVLIFSAAGALSGGGGTQSLVPISVSVKVSISRFSFFAVHPLVIATFAATAALFLISDLFFAEREARIRVFRLPIWPAIPFLILILLSARSRGATLGFLAALLFLVGRRYVFGQGVRRSFIAAAGTAMLAAMIGTAIALVVVMPGGGPIGEFFVRGETAEQLLSMNGRTEILRLVAVLSAEKPFFGHGYLASRSVLLEHIPWAGHAHNGLAESLLNLGLAGTLLLWSAFGTVLLGSARLTMRVAGAQARTPAMLCAAAIFLLANSAVSPGFAGAPEYEFLLLSMATVTYAAVSRQYARGGDSRRPLPTAVVRDSWTNSRGMRPTEVRA